MSTENIQQINLDKELLLRIGSENDEPVVPWDILKSVGDKLEALIQTIAKFSSNPENLTNLNNYKLDFSGFYNGSPVPAFKLNSHPSLSLFNEDNARQAVILDFSRIMNMVDKGNYQAIADGYEQVIAKNEVIRKLYDFTNSAGDIPVTIVKREQEKFLKVYSVRRLKKEVFDKLTVQEITNNQNEKEESTAVAKMIITKAESGKISRKIAESYDDKEAITSLKFDKISFFSKTYVFKFPILFQIYSEGQGTIIENEQLDLYASGETKTEAKIELHSQFDNSYRRLNELHDDQLNPKLLEVKKYLNSIIKTVKDI